MKKAILFTLFFSNFTFCGTLLLCSNLSQKVEPGYFNYDLIYIHEDFIEEKNSLSSTGTFCNKNYVFSNNNFINVERNLDIVSVLCNFKNKGHLECGMAVKDLEKYTKWDLTTFKNEINRKTLEHTWCQYYSNGKGGCASPQPCEIVDEEQVAVERYNNFYSEQLKVNKKIKEAQKTQESKNKI